jgi:hypothetical protein
VRSERRVAAVLAGGTIVGYGVAALARAVTPSLIGHTADLAAVERSFIIPLAFVGTTVVVGFLSWAVARRRVPGLRGWGSVLVLAALLIGGPAQGTIASIRDPGTPVSLEPLPDAASNVGVITPAAAAAMAWISHNTPNDAVMATNRHCASGPEQPRCLSVAFWVSGLGGRRTVLEGWGYASAARSTRDATPFPVRLAINDAVFTHPSAKTIDRLRRDYGASWLIADRSAGPVSAQIAQFADRRFGRGQVTVYELR